MQCEGHQPCGQQSYLQRLDDDKLREDSKEGKKEEEARVEEEEEEDEEGDREHEEADMERGFLLFQ